MLRGGKMGNLKIQAESTDMKNRIEVQARGAGL